MVNTSETLVEYFLPLKILKMCYLLEKLSIFLHDKAPCFSSSHTETASKQWYCFLNSLQVNFQVPSFPDLNVCENLGIIPWRVMFKSVQQPISVYQLTKSQRQAILVVTKVLRREMKFDSCLLFCDLIKWHPSRMRAVVEATQNINQLERNLDYYLIDDFTSVAPYQWHMTPREINTCSKSILFLSIPILVYAVDCRGAGL